MEHLTPEVMKLLLEQPDKYTLKGRRDLTLMSILYDTGSRVQDTETESTNSFAGEKLKEIFKDYNSQHVDRVISLINPVIRGWVSYFRIGNFSTCFRYVKDRVERKVRRHMLRTRKRHGFAWNRWSKHGFIDR